MNLKNKSMKSAVALASSLVIVAGIAAADETTNHTLAVSSQQIAAAENVTGRTAGVVFSLNELEERTLENIQSVNYTRMKSVVVTAAEETMAAIPDGPVLTEEELLWQNRLMADVEDKMNVRAEANAEAEIVGRLRKGDVAEIIEIGDEWTHIRSGQVHGYVKNEYCIYGLDALAYAKENMETQATVIGNGVRIRKGASAESSIATVVSEGAVLTVQTDAEQTEGWVAVQFEGNTGYVSTEFVETGLAVTEAITMAQEQEIARKKAAEEAKKKASQTTSVTAVQNAAYTATADEVILLAAIIQCEAGNEKYEGKVAVGSVVLNRVRSSKYPNTITDVIYESGQFSPVGSGLLDKIIAAGPKDSCIQAAHEALNGTDYTNGAKSFRTVKSGRSGVVIGNHVFF